MTDYGQHIESFLRKAGWESAERVVLAGDLSARRYIRLTRRNGESAVLMDAPPERDSSTSAFVLMTGWLREAGMSAPEIYFGAPEQGLLLLEDFGNMKISELVEGAVEIQREIFDLAFELLLKIRKLPCPALSVPTPQKLVEATRLADQWYPGIDSSLLSGFRQRLETVLLELVSEDASVSLRDFHMDNLMWLPDRDGFGKLGLLDYQDAFIVHPVYDLVSLLTDARTEVKADLRADMLARYAMLSCDNPDRLEIAFAAFSAQRNLRILGIFARAAKLFGKPAHIHKLPRVHSYLMEAISHPVFAEGGYLASEAIPFPSPALLDSFE